MGLELTNPGFLEMGADLGKSAKDTVAKESSFLTDPIVGGVAMGLKAALDVTSARKQRERQAEAMYHNKKAQIESQNSANKSQILNALGSNLAATLRR
jgi:hypothetical protein